MARTCALLITLMAAIAALAACGSGSEGEPPAATASAPSPPAAPPEPATPPTPASLPNGIMLALAQFVSEQAPDGKSKMVPGPARLEFLFRRDGAWRVQALEDPESNVFHKAMVYQAADAPAILTLGGTAAIVKTWTPGEGGAEAATHWQKDFGGKFSRMRDAEVGDLFGDDSAAVAVATHDQGVVAVLRPRAGADFEVLELDRQPDTFVHEIEIGDLDADGVLEVYATPSEPNKLDGTPQSGKVVRYVPRQGEGRVVVADLGDRHAKEILVADVDGDGRDELYVSEEGHVTGEGAAQQLVHPVEIRRYDAGTPPTGGAVIGTIRDRLCRFLTAGDVDGDGVQELVAATFSKGLWLLRPGADPRQAWERELIDDDSAGFEHASILTDLDGDGSDELYVASDRHKQVRRYVWTGRGFARETIYIRPDDRPIFTWNLMPVPVELIPPGD
jgi:hypothetical protein